MYDICELYKIIHNVPDDYEISSYEQAINDLRINPYRYSPFIPNHFIDMKMLKFIYKLSKNIWLVDQCCPKNMKKDMWNYIGNNLYKSKFVDVDQTGWKAEWEPYQ